MADQNFTNRLVCYSRVIFQRVDILFDLPGAHDFYFNFDVILHSILNNTFMLELQKKMS